MQFPSGGSHDTIESVNVFLDSNAWHEDKRLTSTAFGSLCAYLKRTGCSIVLPNLVLEEVLGRYERELKEKCQKAFSAIRDVHRYLIDEGDPDEEFNFFVNRARQVQAFKDRLLKPAPGINTTLFDDSKIDVREVYRRGINRRRPASHDGEELRDVILWLSVLEYTRASKDKVALVTRDKGFWNGDVIHPEIAEDIATNSAEIFLHKDIESFNRANALSSAPLPATEIGKLLNVRALDEKALGKVALILNSVETEKSTVEYRSGLVEDARWEDGTIYEVAEDVRFAEGSYRAEIEAKIVLITKPTKLNWTDAALASLSGGEPKNLSNLAMLAGPRFEPAEAAIKGTYRGQVSMRIIKTTVETPDFDSFQLMDLHN